MTDVDVSSYSCKELCDYLDIYGTDREKLLISKFNDLDKDMESLDSEISELSCYIENLEVEAIEKDDHIDDLDDIIIDLKEKLKNG